MKTSINIPKNVEVHKHMVADFYFDEYGILHSVSKPGPRNIEIMTDYVNYVKKLSDHKKVYILSNISTASPMDKETRNYMNSELVNMFIAMALTSTSPLGRMIGNLLLTLNEPALPVKIFSNEKDGIEWLKVLKSRE